MKHHTLLCLVLSLLICSPVFSGQDPAEKRNWNDPCRSTVAGLVRIRAFNAEIVLILKIFPLSAYP